MGEGVETGSLETSVAAWRRTDLAGALREGDIGRAVVVCGWVHGRRDHGGIVFLDLRDRAGIVQVVLRSDRQRRGARARRPSVRLEYVVAVRGTRRARARRRP